MAIVPNLNGVPISPGTPLSDPHIPSKWEMSFNNNVDMTETRVTAEAGSQLLLAADSTRRACNIYSADGNSLMALSFSAMSGTDEGISLYGGGGYEFNGKTATNAIYLYGVAGQKLVIWTA